jgi:hypothetical protein
MKWLNNLLSKLGTRPKSFDRPVRSEQSGEALAAQREPECKSVGDLASQMDRDYQVKLAMSTLLANVKAVAVTVSVEHGDDRATAIADHLQTLWDQTLTRMLPAFGHGRVAFEKVHEFDDEHLLTVYKKLQDLPYDATSLRLAEDGSYDGIDLAIKGEKEPLHLTAEKTWWLALDPDVLNPHGKSRYQGAAEEVWRDRRKALQLREVFIRKFVLGWAKAHVKPLVENERGEIIDNLEATMDAYSDMRAGGIMAFSNQRDDDGSYLSDIEMLPEVKSVQPLDDAIDGMDAEQLRAFGIPEKTVMEGQAVGSFAMVSQQMLTLFAVVEDILDQFVQSFQRYVIDPLLKANWESPPTVTIGFARLTARPDSLLVETVKGLLLNPQFLEVALSGGLDLRQMLESTGVPITEQFERVAQETLQRIRTAAATVPAFQMSHPPGVGSEAFRTGLAAADRRCGGEGPAAGGGNHPGSPRRGWY